MDGSLGHVARKSSQRAKLTTEEFISSLKQNPAYVGIDIDSELFRMDAWLQTPKGLRRQKTQGFILNWLNRIDRPSDASPRDPIDEWLKKSEAGEVAHG